MRLLIHTAINTRGFITSYVKKRLAALGRETGEEMSLETPGHDHSVNWLSEALREGGLPDVALTHAVDLAVIEKERKQKLFDSLESLYEKYPVRKETAHLSDLDYLVFPVYAIPLVMVFNSRNSAKEKLSGTWKDLLNSELNVIFPDMHTPISQTVLSYLKQRYPNEYQAFLSRLTFGKSPVEVIQALVSGRSGRFELAISNLSFARMARQKGIEVNMPVEGSILLPQVLVIRKDAGETAYRAAGIFLEEELQNYLGAQGVIPVSPDAELNDTDPAILNICQEVWTDWEDYYRRMRL